MSGFSDLVVNFLLAGLFILALLLGGVQLAVNNTGSQSIANEPVIGAVTANLSDELGNTYGTMNASETAVSESQTTITQGTVFLDAMAGVWKTMKVVPVAVYNTAKYFLSATILSGGAFVVVFGVLSGIIILMFVLYAWKVIRTGDPE